jgi:hypothetical protein
MKGKKVWSWLGFDENMIQVAVVARGQKIKR